MEKIDSLTIDEIRDSEAIIVDALRQEYSHLDLRRGGAIRDLVVRPQAAVGAMIASTADETLSIANLYSMRDRDTIDIDAVNAILSNFNTSYREGTTSYGYVRFIFETDVTRVIREGLELGVDDMVFEVADTVIALSRPDNVPQDVGNDVYYDEFVFSGEVRYEVSIPIRSTTVGADRNIPAGTVFNATDSFSGLSEIVAIQSFTGGEDPETIDDIIKRIPYAVASRSLTSVISTKAMLMDRYGAGIVDLNLQGIRSLTQIRNRVSGVKVGGFVDAYVRTFKSPSIAVFYYKATCTDPGVYTIDLPTSDTAGAYAVRAVTDWDGTWAPTGTDASSYTITTSRGIADDTEGHRIQTPLEASLSSYQSISITVYDAVSTIGSTKELKVELYTSPLIHDIQKYCDTVGNRNASIDLVIKSPVVASLRLSAKVHVPANVERPETLLRKRALEYINSNSFVRVFSLSELVQAIGYKVEMPPNRPVLTATIYAMDGSIVKWAGSNDIDIDSIEDIGKGITNETVVFTADPANINLDIITI